MSLFAVLLVALFAVVIAVDLRWRWGTPWALVVLFLAGSGGIVLVFARQMFGLSA